MQMNCMHSHYSSDFIHPSFCFLFPIFPFMVAEELEPNQSLLRGGVPTSWTGHKSITDKLLYDSSNHQIKSLSKL